MTLIELLREHGVATAPPGHPHHNARGWVQVNCPQCSPQGTHFRLGIHERTLAGRCWACGRVGTAWALAALGVPRNALSGLDRPLAHFNDVEASRGIFTPPAGLGPLLPAHLRYLEGRGYEPAALVRLWGLGGLGLCPRYAWRLFVPVTFRGRDVSWTTRAIVDGPGVVRYLSAPADCESVPAKHLVYGFDYVRHAAVIVEGPADVWRVGPGAVATLGLAYTPHQLKQLATVPVRVVAFDKGTDAQMKARQLCRQLAAFPGKTLRVELSGKDPGESPESEIAELRAAFLGEKAV